MQPRAKPSLCALSGEHQSRAAVPSLCRVSALSASCPFVSGEFGVIGFACVAASVLRPQLCRSRSYTVAIFAQGTSWAVAVTQAFSRICALLCAGRICACLCATVGGALGALHSALRRAADGRRRGSIAQWQSVSLVN